MGIRRSRAADSQILAELSAWNSNLVISSRHPLGVYRGKLLTRLFYFSYLVSDGSIVFSIANNNNTPQFFSSSTRSALQPVRRRDVGRIQLGVAICKKLSIWKAVRTNPSSLTRLVMNGCPRNAIRGTCGHGRADGERQAPLKGVLESFEQVRSLVRIGNVGGANRTPMVLTGVRMVLFLLSTTKVVLDHNRTIRFVSRTAGGNARYTHCPGRHLSSRLTHRLAARWTKCTMDE